MKTFRSLNSSGVGFVKRDVSYEASSVAKVGKETGSNGVKRTRFRTLTGPNTYFVSYVAQ